MKKLLFIILLSPSLSWAVNIPEFNHKDTFVKQEFENVGNEIKAARTLALGAAVSSTTLPSGSTNYIQNRTTPQTGATASPQYAIIGTSATIPLLGVTSMTATGRVGIDNGSTGGPSLYFKDDPGHDVGLSLPGTNILGLSVPTGGNVGFYVNSSARVTVSNANLNPSGAANLDFGDASNYWNEINYKTLTDRGCLGWFDDGVEMPGGKKVSDLEVFSLIKMHPTKKTVYGTPMLDYRTFPIVSYKKARVGGKLLKRKDDEPIGGADGIEMTSMFSIMIGALKESNERIKILEDKVAKLENKTK